MRPDGFQALRPYGRILRCAIAHWGKTLRNAEPSYRLRLWRHIEAVFVLVRDPHYDVRTPDMSAGHDRVLTLRSDEKQKGKFENVEVTYRPRACGRPRHCVVADCNRTGKRGPRLRPRLVARTVGPLPGYAVHRSPAAWRIPDRISGGRQRLPSRVLARAVWPLPQHAVPRPPAERQLAITGRAHRPKSNAKTASGRSSLFPQAPPRSRLPYVKPSSGIFNTLPHALQ